MTASNPTEAHQHPQADQLHDHDHDQSFNDCFDQSDNAQPDSKRTRQRTFRACDTCRKMKIKCVLHSHHGPCEGCRITSRPCKFEYVGIKREKPPSIREINELNRRIAQLEALLIGLEPDIDLSSLPRTADQARNMANALRRRPSHPRPPTLADSCSPPACLSPNSDDDGSDEFEGLIRSLEALQYTPGRFASSSSPADQPPNSSPEASVPFRELNVDSLVADSTRSLAERCSEKQLLRSLAQPHIWPPADLATSLVGLYFRKLHPYFFAIVHEGEFRRGFADGLADRDKCFRGLCLAVFAAAAPFSNDPRVLVEPPTPIAHQHQTAGALYAFAAVSHLTPSSLPLSLFELQSMAVLSQYMLALCSPRSAWAGVVHFLRRAIDVGVHTEKASLWNSSLMRDQLRKRAFVALSCTERQLCSSLGFRSTWNPCIFQLAPPLLVDDETLSLLDERDRLQPTLDARLVFRRSLLFPPLTPREAARSTFWMLRQKYVAQYTKLLSVRLQENISDEVFALKLCTELASCLEQDVPPIARWDPALQDTRDLLSTAYVTCMLRVAQIMLHRRIVSVFPEQIQTCLHAAKVVLDILDDLRGRGHLELLGGHVPYFIAPVGLTLLWTVTQDDSPFATAECRANARVDVSRCIQILRVLAPKSFFADSLATMLLEYVSQLEKEMEQAPSPPGGSAPTNPRKRPFSEMVAKQMVNPAVMDLVAHGGSTLPQDGQTAHWWEQPGVGGGVEGRVGPQRAGVETLSAAEVAALLQYPDGQHYTPMMWGTDFGVKTVEQAPPTGDPYALGLGLEVGVGGGVGGEGGGTTPFDGPFLASLNELGLAMAAAGQTAGVVSGAQGQVVFGEMLLGLAAGHGGHGVSGAPGAQGGYQYEQYRGSEGVGSVSSGLPGSASVDGGFDGGGGGFSGIECLAGEVSGFGGVGGTGGDDEVGGVGGIGGGRVGGNTSIADSSWIPLAKSNY